MASYEKRNGKWCVRFRIAENGEYINKRLSGFDRKGDAEKAYREYLIEDKKEVPVTYEEMAHLYLTSKSNDVKESTIVSNESALRMHVFPIIGDKSLDKITAADLETVKKSIFKYSPNYRNHTWTIMGSVFRFADTRYGYSSSRVYNSISPYIRDNNKKDYWTPEEFKKFINAVLNEYTATNDYIHYRYYVLFNFLYFIGTRKGETMALQWKDIDLENAVITIDKSITNKLTKESRDSGLLYKVTDTKTHKKRVVDIPEQLLTILQKFKENEKPLPDESVFFKERPIPAETLRRVFDQYIAIAKVKRITPHQFRHSNASLIISNGGNNEIAITYVVAERLGNSPKMIMEVYGNLFPSAKKDIVSKIKI